MTATLVAVTLTLVAATAEEVAPQQPPNSIGVRLADVPEGQQDDPQALAAISGHVAPGGRLTRQIDVVSTVEEPTTVEVYGGNGRIQNGAFSPDDSDRPGIAEWIVPERPTLTLAPMGVERIEIAIDVPSNAPLGEQYGYVWVEPPASTGEVSITNRVGIRVLLSVGLGGEPEVDFVVGSMTAARDGDGVPIVTTQLRNTGGRALTISGELELTEGPAGLAAGPFPFDGSLFLAPDDIGTMTISLDPELPDGPWLATITASSGLLERTAQAQIDFPVGAGEAGAPEQSETIGGTDADGNDISDQLRQQRRTLLPIAAFLILLALVMLFLLLWWQRKDREEEEEASVSAGVARDDGD